MTALTWDGTGQKVYETGVDHGVLYPINESTGEYDEGFAWNGLTTVTESPSGAESNKQYADNIIYANLYSVEEFGGTIEAFTYPDAFAECDGSESPSAGVTVGQQPRRTFGLVYRTKVANDVSADAGYKLHLVYGATASPSEKAYATINDSPEAIGFSWEFTTVPVPVTGFKPTSLLVIDSTKVDPGGLTALNDILFGTVADDARLPLPDEVLGLVAGTATVVDMEVSTNQPTYNSGTHIVTLPAVTGVQWKINGVNKTAGAQPAMTVGQTSVITAHPLAGYSLHGDTDWSYDY